MWYDQKSVGSSLEAYFRGQINDECQMDDEQYCTNTCLLENLNISTKIPPWELTSVDNIRNRAEESRKMLVGFCDDESILKFPMDVYYIHAPYCWDGWHPRCEGVKDTLNLEEAWIAMEAVVGEDHNTKRVGVSNVWPDQLKKLIQFVKDRQRIYNGQGPPPRMPDVVQAYADPLKPSKELREVCRENGIEFVSYSTLGTQHRRTSDGKNPVLSNSVINSIAVNHQRSAAEVVLSWAIQEGMGVIPRSSNEKHIMELSSLLTQEPFLDAQELSSIDALALF